jgi:hypothetical protein
MPVQPLAGMAERVIRYAERETNMQPSEPRPTIPQLAGIDLDAFVADYIDCAYFTDTGDDEQPPNDAELSLEAHAAALEDCRAFILAAHPLLREAINRVGYDQARAAHDFWYTRNGHGVGFWDRDELTRIVGTSGEPLDSDLGDRLSAIATQFGEVSLCQGDDGRVHFV